MSAETWEVLAGVDNLAGPDSFTAAGNGATIDCTDQAVSKVALQVSGDAVAATAWSVLAEGSLDGATWTSIVTHINGSQANGETVWAVDKAIRYLRSRCVSVTLGAAASIKARVVGLP